MLLLQKDLIELFRRDIKDWYYITACHLLTIKIVGVIGMGLVGRLNRALHFDFAK